MTMASRHERTYDRLEAGEGAARHHLWRRRPAATNCRDSHREWPVRVLAGHPRRREQEYESLVVTVDPQSLQIRALTTFDTQGGESTFTFNNMKENQGVSDKEFTFRIPRGVDVITDGASR